MSGDKYRRRCSVEGCRARVAGRFLTCRVCRAFAAIRKAAQRRRQREATTATQESQEQQQEA